MIVQSNSAAPCEQRRPTGGQLQDITEIRLRLKRRVDLIGDVHGGAVLHDGTCSRFVFLLPDMTEEGRWRMQRFDAKGFSGHQIFNTHDELVEAAAREGFIHPDSTALDRLQDTPAFQRGNFITDLVTRINCREITHDEADRLIGEYDAKVALAH